MQRVRLTAMAKLDQLSSTAFAQGVFVSQTDNEKQSHAFTEFSVYTETLVYVGLYFVLSLLGGSDEHFNYRGCIKIRAVN